MTDKPMHETPDRLEMKVEHVFKTVEHHKLVGKCPKCGKQMETDADEAVALFEQGKSINTDCDNTECQAQLVVPGRSRLITDPKTIVVPGRPDNRHARRARKA